MELPGELLGATTSESPSSPGHLATALPLDKYKHPSSPSCTFHTFFLEISYPKAS